MDEAWLGKINGHNTFVKGLESFKGPHRQALVIILVRQIDELIAALRESWRERDGGLVGTSNCPICGKSTPHHHSAEPAERGDLLPTIKHALNELQMSGESTRLASNEIYPYAIGWLWYLVKRAARAEEEVKRLKDELIQQYAVGLTLQAVREAAEALRPFALIQNWPEMIKLCCALDACKEGSHE